MKKNFNKELLITKEFNEDFESSTKSWICHHSYIDGDVEARDHWHITGKHRSSVHRDCNTNVKLNHKIPIVFHNQKKYDFHFIMQELCKFIHIKCRTKCIGKIHLTLISCSLLIAFIFKFFIR